ncbi:hypothetical protein J6590_045245 [Homalodisca vitripennis]|nr:hypothetical protein J6590_045245 [Homalodisca vitripennis]
MTYCVSHSCLGYNKNIPSPGDTFHHSEPTVLKARDLHGALLGGNCHYPDIEQIQPSPYRTLSQGQQYRVMVVEVVGVRNVLVVPRLDYVIGRQEKEITPACYNA